MPLLPGVLEHVERHHRVLERAVRLAHELVHLRVGRQMHDEIRLGVLDPVDAARERCIVPREVLEEVAEVVRPGVLPLVDAEDLMAVSLQALREVRADLARRAGDEDAH